MGVSINTTKSLGLRVGNRITPPSTAAHDPALILKYTTTSSSESIEIRSRTTNNYDVDWGDSSSDSGVTATTKTHTYAAAGTYTVKITGSFPQPHFGGMSATDRAKLVEMSNWGDVQYTLLFDTFEACSNMQYTATDYPDLSTATANTSSMLRGLFQDCDGITGAIDLTNWTNLECVGSFGLYQMFRGCHNIDSINLSGWTLTHADNSMEVCYQVGTGTTNGCTFTLDNMTWTDNSTFKSFLEKTKINTVSVDNWVLDAVSSVVLTAMFKDSTCPNATLTVNLSSWSNTSQISKIDQTFWGSEITSINTTGWDTSSVTTLAYSFYQASDLTEIVGLSGWKGDSVTTMIQAFQDAQKLSFATHNFDPTLWGASLTNLTNLFSTFRNCSLLVGGTPMNVTGWDTSSVTTMETAFYGTVFSGSINVSSWDFSSVTTLKGFMRLNSGTTSVTFSSISNSCTNFDTLFFDAVSLQTVIFDSSCNLSGVADWDNSFNLVGSPSPLTTFTLDASASLAGATTMSNMFADAPLTVASYDNFLVRAAATNTNAVTFYANLASHTCAPSAAATAEGTLVAAGWTITDAACT
jgi:hypothetical protein